MYYNIKFVFMLYGYYIKLISLVKKFVYKFKIKAETFIKRLKRLRIRLCRYYNNLINKKTVNKLEIYTERFEIGNKI